MHATIPRGVVGGFEFIVLQRNLQQCHERPWTLVCECSKKATIVVRRSSTAAVAGTVYGAYPILPSKIVACTFYRTIFLETAVRSALSTHFIVNGKTFTRK